MCVKQQAEPNSSSSSSSSSSSWKSTLAYFFVGRRHCFCSIFSGPGEFHIIAIVFGCPREIHGRFQSILAFCVSLRVGCTASVSCICWPFSLRVLSVLARSVQIRIERRAIRWQRFRSCVIAASPRATWICCAGALHSEAYTLEV